ncbi:MAG: T9SS type A sorting domain-containing protein [Bacteroidia bacterium]
MKNKIQQYKNKLTSFFFFLFVIAFNSSTASSCISTGNGDWSNASTWSCGHVPACGDSVVILSIYTVTISNQQNYSGCNTTTGILKIAVYGTLQFNTGSKLTLPCNSRFYVMAGGQVTPGNGGGSSNYIEICSTKLWSASDGTLTGPACLPSTLPGCGTVLPIELTNFSASMNGVTIMLNWETASEKNNSRFDIERSEDAVSFNSIKTVQSKAQNGTSTSPLNYTALDENPLTSLSYYRLKQIDIDNAFKYSKIVSVAVSKAKNIRFLVYPNPNNGEFTADISGFENNHNIKVALRDERGTLVYESSFYLQETSGKIQISPAVRLSNGVYTCTFTLEEIDYSVKMVVN